MDPEAFLAKFGAPLEDLERLRDAKTVTLPSLMDVAPEGTQDPTPFLYDTTMYVMAGLLGLAFIANALVRPVDPRYYHFKHQTDDGTQLRLEEGVTKSVSQSGSRSAVQSRAHMLNSMLE